jgi:hypothetical protein
MLNFIRNLIIVICFLYISSVYSISKIQILPNEEIPNEIILENDSLSVKVQLGRYVYFTSFKDKISGVEFIDPATPAPVVKINSQWHLLQVGFNIWQVTEFSNGDKKGVQIELFSDYLENPYHLFIKLTLSDNQELDLDLSIEHQAKPELHDMRYTTRPVLLTGLSLMKYLRPKHAEDPYVIFKNGLTYFHNDTEDVGMFFLRQPEAPTFPIVISYPNLNAGILLNKIETNLNWSFGSAEEALSFMQLTPMNPGEHFVIFKGTLRPFRGNWHTAFYWWKNWIRNQLNLENYYRPGHQEYRRKVVGNFTMAFDHEFYDPVANQYRLKDFLARGKREFGGYDFILFWHGYPRLGVDQRDEWEMYDGLPGGIAGLKKLVEDANKENVWVFLSYNPWDIIGNRGDLNLAQADIMAKTGANGTYLDIMRGASDEFRKIFDDINPDIIFSSENRPPFEGLPYSTGSQEDHEYIMETPRIDLMKFVLPEHCVSNTERMARNRTKQIRNSIFNLVGFTVWEDIFGEINRYSWDERILITRYNYLAHDHMDAYLSLDPIPLIPTRSIAKSLGDDIFLNAWQADPKTYDHPYPPESDSRHSGLYVNLFKTEDKVLYSLFHEEHYTVDRFHDNRIIGRLFEVDLPDNWHLVNVWDGLPAQIIKKNDKKWAYTDIELPDPSCVFVAMPELIRIVKEKEGWNITVPDQKNGYIQLVGMDTERRPVYANKVPVTEGMLVETGQVEANVNGYIMVQYQSEGVAKDVQVIRIDP